MSSRSNSSSPAAQPTPERPRAGPRPDPVASDQVATAETVRRRHRRSMHVRRGADFSRAYRHGNRARGGMMTVAVVPNSFGWTRLGLSVGRRVWRSAVKRNRVRRIFREAFRLNYAELPVGVDLILIGSTPQLVPELEAAREELTYLARKAWRRYREKNPDCGASPGDAKSDDAKNRAPA